MKIKVLFYIDSFRIGGMHKQVLYLAKHLNREKFEPIICVQNTDGGLRNEYEQSGARIESLYWTKRLDFKVFLRLIRLLWMEKPDIIFITEPQNFFYYRVARFFYYGKTIQIGSFRAMNFWYGHLGPIYKFVDSLLSILMILTSKKIIVNSKAMLTRYVRFIPVISKNKTKVIYNGSDFNFKVTTSAPKLRKELKISELCKIIVMIARLDPWKDFDTLLDAALIVNKEVDNIKILLVGDGELKESLEEKISKMQLRNIIYILGEKKDIYNYINFADISVLSTNGEGFSNSILESMAFGKPVIATDVGGNSELLGRSNEHGFLVEAKSSIALAETMLKLLKYEELRVDVGNRAKIYIEKLCDLKTLVTSYEQLFIECIED